MSASMKKLLVRFAFTSKFRSCSYCCRNSNLKTKNVDKEKPDVPVKNDWIGPPHPISSLRPVKFYVPEDESRAEKEFRERRKLVQAWNQQFWKDHNTLFYRSKEQYMSSKLGSCRFDEDGTEKALSANEISRFYKSFLTENHRKHWNYNKEWYRKNVDLLWLALKASLSRFYITFTSTSKHK